MGMSISKKPDAEKELECHGEPKSNAIVKPTGETKVAPITLASTVRSGAGEWDRSFFALLGQWIGCFGISYRLEAGCCLPNQVVCGL